VPLTHNWSLRRAQVASIISRDTWTIVFVGRDDSADDPVRTSEATGTIRPVEPRVRANVEILTGEPPVTHYTHVALMPWDTDPLPRRGDTCKATQDSTGIEHNYAVVFVDRYAYRTEVLLDELQ